MQVTDNQKLFKKKYKKLYKLYEKQLKQAHKKAYNSFQNPMDYFITYLKFMRDYYILLNKPKDTKFEIKFASLAAAIDEYNQYFKCLSKYFVVDKSGLALAPKDGKTFQEATDAFTLESAEHWTNFWLLVSTNMQSWMELGD